MAQVNLTVNGRVYRLACGDGEEEHVLELGARFNDTIEELRQQVGELGDTRLMVMAGILMTDRLNDAEHRLKRLEADIRDLKESRLDSSSRMEGLEQNFAESLEAAAARIEALAERLYAEPRLPDDGG
jgi:cell division protein ZapA